MTRSLYEAVTGKESFTILVPASLSNADGESTFQMELGGPQPVRAVTVQELKKAGVKMKGAPGAIFWALLALRNALESRDELALSDAKVRLERAYRLRETEQTFQSFPGEESRLRYGALMAPVIGMSAEESLKHLEGLRPGPRAKANLHRLLSYEVSLAVGLMNAEIVLSG